MYQLAWISTLLQSRMKRYCGDCGKNDNNNKFWGVHAKNAIELSGTLWGSGSILTTLRFSSVHINQSTWATAACFYGQIMLCLALCSIMMAKCKNESKCQHQQVTQSKLETSSPKVINIHITHKLWSTVRFRHMTNSCRYIPLLNTNVNVVEYVNKCQHALMHLASHTPSGIISKSIRDHIAGQKHLFYASSKPQRQYRCAWKPPRCMKSTWLWAQWWGEGASHTHHWTYALCMQMGRPEQNLPACAISDATSVLPS